MARPRIFISSTYFDLKSIREELDRFVSSLGYEPIRHELGHISYGRDEAPEQYAYREVEFADILISVIGSKYGSIAYDGESSISKLELKRAYEAGKQVYIFIEEGVHAEYKFFQANRNNENVKYTAVTDTKVYEFVEEVYALPYGNPVFSFKTGTDLVQTLREQWAGLFQRLLSQDAGRRLTALTEQLQQSLKTVNELVDYLKRDHKNDTDALQQILFSNHPLFGRIKGIFRNRYRLYFTNYDELNDWISSARSFKRIEPNADDLTFIWMKEVKPLGDRPVYYETMEVSRSLFDPDGKLKPPMPGEWTDELVKFRRESEIPGRFPLVPKIDQGELL